MMVGVDPPGSLHDLNLPLVTPFAQARYQIDHTDAPLDRVAFKNYESGHMAYLGEAAARAFAQDLRDFIRR